MKNLQKGFIVPVVIAIIAVLAIGGGVYYKVQKDEVSKESENKFPITSNNEVQSQNNQLGNNQSQQQTNTQTPPTSPQANWKTISGSYKSTNYQVKLPSDFKEKSVQANSEWHTKSFENSTYNFYILVEPIARLSLFSENLPPKTLAQVADALKNRNTYGSVVAQKEIKVAGVQALLQDGYSLADSGGFVHLSTVLLSGDNFIVLTLSYKQNDWAKVKDVEFVRARLTQDFRDLNNQILSTFKFISPSVTINNEDALNQWTYVTKFYNQDGQNFIDVDFVDLKMGEGPSDGHFRFINNNPKIRTFKVSNQIKIEDRFTNAGPGSEMESISLNELEARLLKYKNLSSKQLAVQITAEDGVVTLINIPWRP